MRLHRVVAWRRSVVLLAAILASVAATDAHAACDDVVPAPAPASAPANDKLRDVTTDDLLRLRDIGQPDGAMIGQPSPLAVSPDGKQVAFLINRADPDANAYCRALVVLPLEGRTNPRVLDRGGELITNRTVARGLVYENGFPAIVAPTWSPDGRWLAYLRRDGGITQIWRVRADGTDAAEPLTQSPVDILAVAWTADGQKLAYVAQTDTREHLREVERESLQGWLYDERFAPNVAARPLLPGNLARRAYTVDLASARVAEATASERALLPDKDTSGSAIPPSAVASNGRRAWTERRDHSPMAPLKLVVADLSGQEIACRFSACDGGFTGLWWTADGRELRFLRREGWANEVMAFYRWIPGDRAPRRVFATTDVLLGCVEAQRDLLCTRENATTTRRIVRLDPLTGRSRTVFDPNPEFTAIRLGTVERLRWRNHLGLEAWGDLVLPPDYRPGQRLPMVVVQYHSDGFLRGGTGDEYPIYAFAARGYAVLSVERAAFFAEARPDLTDEDQINAANARDWAERRSLLSSLVKGVEMVVERGIADPARIGITGLSDGASTARFALINTRLFAAAAISTCCIEPRTVMTYGGPAFAAAQRAMGYPAATQENPSFWRPYSMALNASDMGTPLLMQVSDDEYLLALETFTALREHNQPVEMYVFPGEHHIKWQPAHRRAIYQRNLDWFDFWLRSVRDPDPAKAGQYARWLELRDRASSG